MRPAVAGSAFVGAPLCTRRHRLGARATVVIYPVCELWAYTDDMGGIHTGRFDGQALDDWNAPMVDGPHRLRLVRRGTTWLLCDDFTDGGDGDVPTLLKASGASPTLWHSVARRIAARASAAGGLTRSTPFHGHSCKSPAESTAQF